MCQMFLSTDEHLRALEVKGEQIIDSATRDSAFTLTSVGLLALGGLDIVLYLSCDDTLEDPQQ